MKIDIGPYPDGDEQRQVEVHIDNYDIWSMDHTLALIVYPMLKLLKEKKHGAPFVEDSDVPEAIRSTSAKPKENEWDTDEFHFARWDYILDEMIWGFEQMTKDSTGEDQFYSSNKVDNFTDISPDYIVGFWLDDKGLKEHQERVKNACRLFGLYLQNLWT